MRPILVVDDDPAVLGTISDILDHCGYMADPAQSVDEALKKITATDYSLVITDIVMPPNCRRMGNASPLWRRLSERARRRRKFTCVRWTNGTRHPFLELKEPSIHSFPRMANGLVS